MLLKKICCCLSLVMSAAFAQNNLNEAAPAAPAAEPTAPVAEAPKADENTSTVSVFVKNPEEIKALQEDLKNLQTMAGGSNPEIDSLMQKANRIAEMNARCASISLTETLDSTCGHFYEVELPAFENKFMELTGEVRLGSMRMATTLEERTRQLASCSEALTSIVVSRDQLLRLRGNIYLEPINFDGDFDAEYNFTLSYDPARLEQQQRLANLWIEKCGPIVLRQSGNEFAPMFIATLKVKNDSLKKGGSNVKFMMNKKDLKLRIDMRRPMNGAYYMNGIRMFEKTLDASNTQSLLHFDIKNKKALLTLPKDSVIENFIGRKEFTKFKKTEMIGRWMWDADKLPEAVPQATPSEEAEAIAKGDEAEAMTKEDSLAYQKGLEELAQAEAAAKAEEEQRREAAIKAKKEELAKKAAEEQAVRDEQAKLAAEQAAAVADVPPSDKPVVRIIPLIASGVVLIGGSVMAVLFDSKAKKEVDDYKSFVESNPDPDYEAKRFDEHKESVKKDQRNRNIGIVGAIVGAVGVGLSFVF